MRKKYYTSLSNKKIISFLFKKGKKIFEKNVAIRFSLLQDSADFSIQVLWALPRSFKTAVKRNYAKRVLRMLFLEILQEQIFLEKPKAILYIAILPRPQFFEQKYLEQKQELRNIIKKLSQKL